VFVNVNVFVYVDVSVSVNVGDAHWSCMITVETGEAAAPGYESEALFSQLHWATCWLFVSHICHV
jgi:hypothetical protein